MLLSEEIRLGAMLRKQARGKLHTTPGRGHKAATCALGAALESLGCRPKKRIAGPGEVDRRGDSIAGMSVVTYFWPEALIPFLNSTAACPCGCGMRDKINLVIPHLNDVREWTRERIADWVESIERERGLIPTREDALVEQTEGMLDVLAKVTR